MEESMIPGLKQPNRILTLRASLNRGVMAHGLVRNAVLKQINSLS
jgi:hypothetical protein